MNDALGARGPADPRRWITLAIAVMATAIILIDNTVLTVAIPTILRDFHTDLPSLQWVITGYALTFATFLIVGGRLGDIFGHRRTFMVGTALFGTGSLLASLSTSVPTLIVGEAVVEGVGAALMLPATLAILSNTFEGHERPTAFAAWGAVAGAAGAFGPLLGGFLTTNYSWRWSFRINVIIAPVTIVGALVFMSQDAPRSEHLRVDVAGAAMVAVGTLLLVFGLSEGATYGWFRPVERVSIAGASLWPRRWPVSVIPVAFGAAAVLLWAFWVVERSKERRDAGPLFEFGQLRHRGFRYGLITVGIQSMGTFGLIFVLPVFLQNGKHLSAEDNGLWLFPLGMSLMIGSHIGGVLTRRIGATAVARTGLLLATTGLLYIALRLSPSTGFVDLLPGFLCYGTGAGFAASQLTNVILSDVPRDKAGVASGANSTGRPGRCRTRRRSARLPALRRDHPPCGGGHPARARAARRSAGAGAFGPARQGGQLRAPGGHAPGRGAGPRPGHALGAQRRRPSGAALRRERARLRQRAVAADPPRVAGGAGHRHRPRRVLTGPSRTIGCAPLTTGVVRTALPHRPRGAAATACDPGRRRSR